METAFERKKEKYRDPQHALKLGGRCPLTCRGFTRKSVHFLKALGVTGSKQKHTLNEVAKELEQRSFWLWLRINDQDGKKDLQANCSEQYCCPTM